MIAYYFYNDYFNKGDFLLYHKKEFKREYFPPLLKFLKNCDFITNYNVRHIME